MTRQVFFPWGSPGISKSALIAELLGDNGSRLAADMQARKEDFVFKRGEAPRAVNRFYIPFDQSGSMSEPGPSPSNEVQAYIRRFLRGGEWKALEMWL